MRTRRSTVGGADTRSSERQFAASSDSQNTLGLSQDDSSPKIGSNNRRMKRHDRSSKTMKTTTDDAILHQEESATTSSDREQSPQDSKEGEKKKSPNLHYAHAEMIGTPEHSGDGNSGKVKAGRRQSINTLSSPSFLFADDPATFFNFNKSEIDDTKMDVDPLTCLSNGSIEKTQKPKRVISGNTVEPTTTPRTKRRQMITRAYSSEFEPVVTGDNSKINDDRMDEDHQTKDAKMLDAEEPLSDSDKARSGPVPDNEHEGNKGKKNSRPNFLNMSTLSLIKDYLITKDGHVAPAVANDNCDEDEIMIFMIKMNRNADYHTSFLAHHQLERKNIVRKKLNKEDESSGQEEADDDGENGIAQLIEQFQVVGEEQALGKELFSKMVQNITQNDVEKYKDTKKRSKRKKNEQQPIVLDKRTLLWLKKAAGIHTTDSAVASLAAASKAGVIHPSMTGILDGQGRRFTRGMAQKHRLRKEQKKKPGLNALALALEDLQSEIGSCQTIEQPPTEKTRTKSTKQARLSEDVSERKDGKGDREKDTSRDKDVKRKRKKAALDEEKEKKRARVGRPRKEEKQINISATFDPTDNSTVPGPLPLRLQHWMFRNSDVSRSKVGISTNESLYDPSTARPPDSLPLCYKEQNLTIRHPSWPMVNPNQVHSSTSMIHKRLGSTSQEKSIFSKHCENLSSCLSGKARQQARFEFFYSDLDKAWYNRNEFVREAAKLGVPPGIKLTVEEWRAVRRLIGKSRKVRRFSKAFISDQLKHRNRYRSSVRRIQSNAHPGEGLHLDLDWDEPVPARIPVGSIVTAFNSRFRILQRGVVVSYETARNLYLIRFPPKYGNLFCPDYEVARHGLPQILLPGKSAILGQATRQLANPSTAFACSVGFGTSLKDLSSSIPNQSWSLDDIDNPIRLCGQEGVNYLARSRVCNKTMVNDIAEREMVALILGTVENALSRKEKILDCLAALQRSSGMLHERSVDRKHYAWLLANLDAVNQALEEGCHYMKTLYGPCYRSPIGHLSTNPSKEEILSWLVKARKSSELTSIDPPALEPSQSKIDEWSRRLLLDSEDICRHVLRDLSIDEDVDEDGSDLLVGHAANLGAFLLASSYMEHRVHEITSVYGLGAIMTATQDIVDGIPEPELWPCWNRNQNASMDHFADALANQKEARESLEDAMTAWNVEMAMQTTIPC